MFSLFKFSPVLLFVKWEGKCKLFKNVVTLFSVSYWDIFCCKKSTIFCLYLSIISFTCSGINVSNSGHIFSPFSFALSLFLPIYKSSGNNGFNNILLVVLNVSASFVDWWYILLFKSNIFWPNSFSAFNLLLKSFKSIYFLHFSNVFSTTNNLLTNFPWKVKASPYPKPCFSNLAIEASLNFWYIKPRKYWWRFNKKFWNSSFITLVVGFTLPKWAADLNDSDIPNNNWAWRVYSGFGIFWATSTISICPYIIHILQRYLKWLGYKS